MNRGMLLATGTYFLFGILPLYWRLLSSVPAGEILAHRIAWSFLFLALYLGVKRRFSWLLSFFKNGQQLRQALATTVLVTGNWGIYIWAVNAGHVLESSLGYFINPLASVLLGVIVLGEKLRPWQWFSTSLASIGVLYLAINHGQFPWIALGLAGTFSLYGMLKKRSSLNTMQGMFAETAGAFLPAVGYLLWQEFHGAGSFGSDGLTVSSLLAVSGIVTAIPLILFAAAAKQIPLSTLGILQYLTPTLQFLIGAFVFKEDLGSERLVGFAIIWLALLAFTSESVFHKRSTSRKLAPKAVTP